MGEGGDVQHALGQHDARLAEIERWRGRMEDRMNARFDAQDARLGAIQTTLDKLAGGWKLVLILGAGLALVSDGALKIYHVLFAR